MYSKKKEKRNNDIFFVKMTLIGTSNKRNGDGKYEQTSPTVNVNASRAEYVLNIHFSHSVVVDVVLAVVVVVLKSYRVYGAVYYNNFDSCRKIKSITLSLSMYAK